MGSQKVACDCENGTKKNKGSECAEYHLLFRIHRNVPLALDQAKSVNIIWEFNLPNSSAVGLEDLPFALIAEFKSKAACQAHSKMCQPYGTHCVSAKSRHQLFNVGSRYLLRSLPAVDKFNV
jgi:hypothetical protein